MMLCSSWRLVDLMIKVMLFISFTHGKLCGNVIPTNVRCRISILEDGDAKINVSWLFSRTATNYVQHFDVSCDCLVLDFDSGKAYISDHNAMYRVYQQLMKSINKAPCYDECRCHISMRSTPCFNLNGKSSDPTTCYILPSGPKEPPVITSLPNRIISSDHNRNLVQVNFMLPPTNLFCDTYINVKGITVSITQCDNGAHQYHYYQLRPLRNDSGNYTYTFEFPDEQFQFWKPFSIAVAVNNSVKLSPFSDYAVIRKDDIIRSTSDYTFQCTHDFNSELSMYVLRLFWNLSEKAQHMLNSHFVTGFQFTMEQIGGDDNVTMYYMNDTNFTLRTSLKSNEWYLLVGRILFAGDEGSYGPEPFYITFRTTNPSSKANSTADDIGDDNDGNNKNYNKYLLIIVLISACLGITMIIIILLLIHIRTTSMRLSNVSNYCDHDDDYGNEDDSSIAEPGIMLSVGSYLEDKEAESEVEN